MEVFFLFLLFELALAADGQRVVLEPDIDVVLIDARDFELQSDLVLVLVNVNRRNEAAAGSQFVLTSTAIVLKETVHAILQRSKLTKRVPTCNDHDVFSSKKLLNRNCAWHRAQLQALMRT